MTFSNSDTQVEHSDDPVFSERDLSGDILTSAFDALTDAIYVFSADRCLSRFNHAALMLQGPTDLPLGGRACCEMFWRVEEEGACVVDRAIESNIRCSRSFSRLMISSAVFFCRNSVKYSSMY